jgi:ketosteroid isomerase-like protein
VPRIPRDGTGAGRFRIVVADDPVTQVQAIWEAYARGGLEAMLDLAGDDVDWRPHQAGGRVLHGSDEMRAFYAEREIAGVRMEPTVYELERHGDAVVMTGALRVLSHGRLTESQLAWVYTFSDGRLQSASAYPTRAEALRAVAVAV